MSCLLCKNKFLWDQHEERLVQKRVYGRKGTWETLLSESCFIATFSPVRVSMPLKTCGREGTQRGTCVSRRREADFC